MSLSFFLSFSVFYLHPLPPSTASTTRKTFFSLSPCYLYISAISLYISFLYVYFSIYIFIYLNKQLSIYLWYSTKALQITSFK